MSFVLVSTSGDRRFALAPDAVLVAGRDLACDLPVIDPAVSRRHAELRVDASGVTITDLGSRNGTLLNGARVLQAHAGPGDTIAFGTVLFTLLDAADAAQQAAQRTVTLPAPLDDARTVTRERSVLSRDAAVVEVAGERLGRLVALAQGLGGLSDADTLLRAIADHMLAAFDADRVAVVLRAANGTMDVRVARDVRGADVQRAVPRAIVNGVAERQVALLTHDARADARTAGESVVRQAIRSAMAAPMLGDGHVTLGVLYVDNGRAASAFGDDDLNFLVAFAGIAAAAVEREAVASRLRHATHVRENFERYFSPQLAARIAGSTDVISLGGHRQQVVVLFSDIRGFTALAESMPPVDMAAQLNEYFGAMMECVFAHDGALDKFIGDALLAYWGAPEPRADDAARAVSAAGAMRTALDTLNARWRRERRPEWHAGMAVHCGEAFLGNIGSPKRLEYTIIGDTVNVASKLCGVAKGGEILVTDVVRRALDANRLLRERADIVPDRRGGGVMRVWEVPA